jgi:hypothetical protein
MVIKIMDLPPMPRNRSHMLTVSGGRPMNIKTPLCREFEKDLEHRLSVYSEEMAEFKAAFIPKSHYIIMQMYVFTPRELLYTKEGHISSRSVDVDAHKAHIDTVFRCIGLDDKLVRDYGICTPVSTDGKYNYLIKIKLELLCNLENMSILMPSTTEQTKLDLMSYALL